MVAHAHQWPVLAVESLRQREDEVERLLALALLRELVRLVHENHPPARLLHLLHDALQLAHPLVVQLRTGRLHHHRLLRQHLPKPPPPIPDRL
eukprot:1192491-Prorocentrum_minimum.AAC.5